MKCNPNRLMKRRGTRRYSWYVPTRTQVDVWALGCLAFELITGRRPFYLHGDAEKIPEIEAAILAGETTPIIVHPAEPRYVVSVICYDSNCTRRMMPDKASYLHILRSLHMIDGAHLLMPRTQLPSSIQKFTNKASPDPWDR